MPLVRGGDHVWRLYILHDASCAQLAYMYCCSDDVSAGSEEAHEVPGPAQGVKQLHQQGAAGTGTQMDDEVRCHTAMLYLSAWTCCVLSAPVDDDDDDAQHMHKNSHDPPTQPA